MASATFTRKVTVSRKNSAAGVAAANHHGMKEFASIIIVGEAARDAAYGYSDPARREVNEALQLQSGSKDARVSAARTLALLGEPPRRRS